MVARRARTRSRAARQNNRLRILGQDLVDRHGMRDQLGVHACFAHAAGDELGVLAPKSTTSTGPFAIDIPLTFIGILRAEHP